MEPEGKPLTQDGRNESLPGQKSVRSRWQSEWIQEVKDCLCDPTKGKSAIQKLTWYTEENGFDRSQHWAEGECIDLRGLMLEKLSSPGLDLSAARLDDCWFIDCAFPNAKFRFASMNRTHFTRVDLSSADLCLVKLNEGQFLDVNVSGADCGAIFRNFNWASGKAHKTSSRAADFRDATIQDLQWDDETDFRWANLAGASFTHTPSLKRHIEDQQWLWAKQQEMRKTRYGTLLWHLWGITSKHGRSFFRWLAVSFLLSLLFGTLYQFVPLALRVGNVSPVLAKYYFSVVTFTTLGFGDVTPASDLAAVLVMIEVVCGYLMLGVLISILADKFARRS